MLAAKRPAFDDFPRMPPDDSTDLRPRRRPAQERSQETIAAILNATAELLEAGGAGAVTTNKIAEQAGISVGSLYHFFKNKQSIYAALFETQLGRFNERISEFFDESYDDLAIEEFIDRMMDRVGESYLNTPALAVLLLTMQTDPALDNISLENRTRFAGRVADLIGRRAPDASPAQTQAGAVIIVETVNAVFRRWMALQADRRQSRALLAELKQNLSIYIRNRFL